MCIRPVTKLTPEQNALFMRACKSGELEPNDSAEIFISDMSRYAAEEVSKYARKEDARVKRLQEGKAILSELTGTEFDFDASFKCLVNKSPLKTKNHNTLTRLKKAARGEAIDWVYPEDDLSRVVIFDMDANLLQTVSQGAVGRLANPPRPPRDDIPPRSDSANRGDS